MLRLLIDTSTWLDIAKRRDGQKWIVPIRVFVLHNRLELLVPSVILEEFERNRPHVEASVTTSVQNRFRQLREDMQSYGGTRRDEWLEEVSHRIPLISSTALKNFNEIHDLLMNGRRLEPTSNEYSLVVERGLAKQAPFNRNKNSTADALIIEHYGSVVLEGDSAEHQHCFVTSNYEDFSAPGSNRNTPHPDIASFFEGANSRYCYDIDGFTSALEDYLGDDYRREVEEVELLHQEPRSLSEILEAEQEFFDKVWYIRMLIRADKRVKEDHEDPEQMIRITEHKDAVDRYIRGFERVRLLATKFSKEELPLLTGLSEGLVGQYLDLLEAHGLASAPAK
jgi:hypothetical protein